RKLLLPEQRLLEAAQFAGVEAVHFPAQEADGFQADGEVFADGAFVEGVCAAGQFDFAVEWFVGDAQQGAVWHAQSVSLGGDGSAFHIDCDGAGEVDVASFLRPSQFPVSVVVGDDGSGAQALFQFGSVSAGDGGGGVLQGGLDFGQRGQGDVRRHAVVEDVVVPQVGVGQHVVSDALRGAQAAAVSHHQPAVRAQHGEVVGDGFGVGGADADVHQRDALIVWRHEVVGGHLVASPR